MRNYIFKVKVGTKIHEFKAPCASNTSALDRLWKCEHLRGGIIIDAYYGGGFSSKQEGMVRLDELKGREVSAPAKINKVFEEFDEFGFCEEVDKQCSKKED